MRYLSVFEQDSEILKAIRDIHLHKWYDADITYSKGVFWKGLEKPKRCSDLIPLFNFVTKDDSTVLETYSNDSLSSVVFDPPFLFRNRGSKNNDQMCARFSYFKSYDELLRMYQRSILAIHKKLSDGGVLAFKCQDMTDGGFYCTHNDIINFATQNGFILKDILIKVSKHKWQKEAKQQNCVAKVHSYWLIFKKRKNLVGKT